MEPLTSGSTVGLLDVRTWFHARHVRDDERGGAVDQRAVESARLAQRSRHVSATHDIAIDGFYIRALT